MKYLTKKNFFWLSVAAGVFLIALWLGGRNSSSEGVVGETQYEYTKVRLGDIDIVVSGIGQLQSAQQVDLNAVAAGDATDVTEVYVKNNQEVTKGQLLISLDSREASRKVYDAQLALDSAEITLKKISDTFDKQTVDDKRERQLKEIAVKDRSSALAQAQDNLADYQIRAPFDGVITDLTISSGDSISRTDVFASVITEDNKVVVSLNEIDALSVEEGNTSILTFDAIQGLEITGKVSRVDTIGISTSGVVSYDIEISLDNQNYEKLRPGMSVNAEITAESIEDVIIIPNSAVKGFGDSAYVEQMSDDGVSQTAVQLGTSNDFYTQIISGLSKGDQIITSTTTIQEAKEDDSVSLFGNMRMPGSGGRR